MQEMIRRTKVGLTWLLEQVVTLLVAALVLDVLWGICTRFLLNSPSRWSEEVATFLLIWVSLLGAAVAFIHHEHLGVDYFVNKLDSAAQRTLRIVVQGLVILFAAWAMIYGGFVLVVETLRAGQLTPALGIHMGYVYLAAPVSGAFIALNAVEQVVELLTDSDSVEDAASEGASTGSEAV